jgi:hypothetical protein
MYIKVIEEAHSSKLSTAEYMQLKLYKNDIRVQELQQVVSQMELSQAAIKESHEQAMAENNALIKDLRSNLAKVEKSLLEWQSAYNGLKMQFEAKPKEVIKEVQVVKTVLDQTKVNQLSKELADTEAKLIHADLEKLNLLTENRTLKQRITNANKYIDDTNLFSTKQF